MFMYCNQLYSVSWGGCLSNTFSVSNGVPQGRILSPSFFNLYMNDLSLRLRETGMGCFMSNLIINHLFYADDAVLLAPSPYVLQLLLNVLNMQRSTS